MQLQKIGAEAHRNLETLCNQRYQLLGKKYRLLPDQFSSFDFSFANPIIVQLYNIITDDADETLPLVGPLTLRELIVRTLLNNANETKERSLAGSINAAGICNGGGCPMLREIVYNELMALGKTEAVAKEWGAVAAEFEQVCGEKKSYNRADVIAFLTHLRKRGLQQSTIDKDLKAIKVVARVQGWQFPKLPLKRVNPDEIRRTILSKETLGSMITLGKQGLLKDIELCYLALATTYGLRRVEMMRLKPASFPDEHHLVVDTAKGGSRTTHLIPPQITPYLTCFKHYKADSLTHMFHRIAGKCGLDTGAGYGWHSIRRSLATELILSEASHLNVSRFMRWSDASVKGEFAMLAIYAKKDQKRIDQDIFGIHPFLSFWGTSELRQTEKVQIEKVSKLQPLIDLIESGELDVEEINQLITLGKQKIKGGSYGKRV